ncbi:hypothetical protein PVIIG_05405 [Plasmodium vivax India VII]|uniref:PIR Superfamily Protein n=1 Tax=Plasmodium vivax India VII TaxID=1077284 RepID=A0A0J9UTV9_PLAVI|nr:hypothetical protein PVIIG_05405 [Plasmodium vivax India VII]
MSSNKLDIEQLRKDYPFFTNIWTFYEEFEKHLDDDDKWLKYENICKATLGPTDMKNEKYVNFCIKLIRNLVSPSDYTKVHSPRGERCNSLNYWIYHNLEDLKLSQKFINDIFTESEDLINGYTNKRICLNLYNESLKESQKIIKLLYLQDNIEIFLKKMKNKGDEDYCICENYIYECVNIYKSMSKLYCSNEDDRLKNHKSTCGALTAFKDAYMAFLFTEEDMSNKIPSLIEDNANNLIKCEPKEKKIEFQAVEDGYIQDYQEEEER